MLESAHSILKNIYGYDEFRGQQQDIINTLIDGNSALVLMPTGGGKSLCYQIPALARPGVGVVVSPLIALMQDQVDALQALGIEGAFINSTLSASEVARTEKALLDGSLDLLYVAPERLLMPRMLDLLRQASISLFAIDEAHCVSQWGHDFRKEYLGLSVLALEFPEVPRIALTATADQRSRAEIASQLGLQSAKKFVASFDRPNIRYHISEAVAGKNDLWRFIEEQHAQDSGIVYCLSRKKVESTAEWLSQQGRTALPYHAGLDSSVRARHQKRFLREEGVIIVATIAFGMGIDKPDVRFVAHLNLPKSMEAYYQETGRAGRDGLPANAWMSYGLQDVISLRNLMQSSDADDQHRNVEFQKLESMLGFAELTACRRHALLGYFSETAPATCGNCDNCISAPETWDATESARKALSCVYRTQQRYGVNYVIDVLLGKESERILQAGHQHVSTYGLGADLSATEWRSIFRQLIGLGLLRSEQESYGVLKLTEQARPVLRGEQSLHLRKASKPALRKSKKRAVALDMNSADKPLWEALRDCRSRLADEQSVPAYIVFSDATLLAILQQRPQSLTEFAAISGVGKAKLQRYADDFLDVIAGFEPNEVAAFE